MHLFRVPLEVLYCSIFSDSGIFESFRYWWKCESECASNGILDVLTNLLMKAQGDAVFEYRNHKFGVSL